MSGDAYDTLATIRHLRNTGGDEALTEAVVDTIREATGGRRKRAVIAIHALAGLAKHLLH